MLWDVKLRRGELESKPTDIKSASSLLPDSFVFQLDVFHEVIYIYSCLRFATHDCRNRIEKIMVVGVLVHGSRVLTHLPIGD